MHVLNTLGHHTFGTHWWLSGKIRSQARSHASATLLRAHEKIVCKGRLGRNLQRQRDFLQREEYDLLSDDPADLLDDHTWSQLIRRAECGAYHVVLVARAPFSGTKGPRPLLPTAPNGLPDIRRIRERKAVEQNNRLHDRTRQLVLAGHNAARRASWLIEFQRTLEGI